jgi:hypothetical protein
VPGLEIVDGFVDVLAVIEDTVARIDLLPASILIGIVLHLYVFL